MKCSDEISIGDYVRTDKGIITKAQEHFIDGLLNGKSAFGKAVKHSKEIIDLIEVDDIGIMNCYGLKVKKFITKDDILELKCRNYELLSIITKEQIKQIEFIIKE